jgi:hypothetical protein
MSDANRTKIGYSQRETTYNVIPTSPVIRNLRVTGGGLTIDPQFVESKELRSDRMPGEPILVGVDVGGSLPLEWSWRNADDIIEDAVQSLWVRTPVRDNNGTADSEVTDVTVTTGVYSILTTGATNTDYHFGAFAIGHLVRAAGFTNAANNGLYRVSAATATSVTLGNTSVAESAPAAAARLKVVGFRGAAGDITATASGLASTALALNTLGLVQGQWIKVGGSVAGEQFATAANNGWARVNGTITATALPLDNLPIGWSVDAGAAKTITVYFGDVLKNGVTESTRTYEQQYPDLAVPEYDYLPGMAVDEFTLSVRARQPIEATVKFMGGGVLSMNGTVRAAGATDVAAPTNDVMSASANVGVVSENGLALSAAVTSFDLTLRNSKRRRDVVGSLYNQDDASGAFRSEASVSMYYNSNVIRTKILARTPSSFTTRIVDASAPVNSRAYVIDLPRIIYTGGGNVNVPGIDTDRTLDPTFTAHAHAVLGYSFSLQRLEEYYP